MLTSSRLTRMRQMACHPDLVLRSKTNAGSFLPDDVGEATVCRLCNDIAEDAIQAKCRHIFDRECIKQYLNTAIEPMVSPVLTQRSIWHSHCAMYQPACPVCHIPLTIDFYCENCDAVLMSHLNLRTYDPVREILNLRYS